VASRSTSVIALVPEPVSTARLCDAELLKDPAHVRLDRFRRDVQLAGDRLVLETVRDQLENLDFARRERVVTSCARGTRRRRRLSRHMAGRRKPDSERRVAAVQCPHLVPDHDLVALAVAQLGNPDGGASLERGHRIGAPRHVGESKAQQSLAISSEHPAGEAVRRDETATLVRDEHRGRRGVDRSAENARLHLLLKELGHSWDRHRGTCKTCCCPSVE
jgi:hypothetical protein